MNLKETYNRIAEDWHRDHQPDDWWIEGADVFVALLKPGALVLDVGCGGGTASKYFLEKGLRVIGTDFAEKQIEIAERNVPDAAFLVSDLKGTDALPYDFDGIFMKAVLLHVQKKEAAETLKTVVKRLKDGGCLYVSVKEQRPGQAEEEVKIEDDYGYRYERFFSYFTQDEVEDYMREASLEIVHAETEGSGHTKWIQVIGRRFK